MGCKYNYLKMLITDVDNLVIHGRFGGTGAGDLVE